MVISVEYSEIIGRIFGEERVALYEAEVKLLVKRGYVKEHISAFLESYILPVGVFDLLSMLRRSKLRIRDLENSLLFLFNRHVIITEILLEHLSPKSRVLDLGCGRGLVSCSLARLSFEVHGVDISEEYLEIAKNLAEKLNCKPKFHLIKENELPFPDEHFDAALCVWTLHEVPHHRMPKLLNELYRTLRKKGSAFMIDQERVTPFETIKRTMHRTGFKLEMERALSLVYDHGRTSRSLMLEFVKET